MKPKEVITFILEIIVGLILATVLLAFWIGIGLFIYCMVT